MANVLTLPDKKLYKHVRMLRTVTVAGIVVSLASMVGIASLAPAFMRAQNTLSDEQARLQTIQTGDTDTVRQQVNTQAFLVRSQVDALSKTVNSDSVHTLYSALMVVQAQNGAIVVTHIAYDTSGAAPTLRISGTARTREDLATFGRALQQNQPTHTAQIPVSLFAGNQTIEFSIPIAVEAAPSQ
jgi:hypothetical protein